MEGRGEEGKWVTANYKFIKKNLERNRWKKLETTRLEFRQEE
jgi:hypothetical protein